jgi:hypothetical protein
MSSISTLPSTIIKAGLQGLRLPLTAIEFATHNGETAAWPPSLAYESFEAGAKQVLGSLVRDEALVREGRLQRAKINELVEAEHLEVEAEQKRQLADAQVEEHRQAADNARERAEEQAEQRTRQVAQQKAEKERSVQEDAARREQAAAKSAAQRDKVVTAEERRAARTRITEESAALSKRSEALAAQRNAASLDDALEAKKAQRKA